MSWLRVWIFVFPRAKFETEKHKHSEGMANMLMKFNFALKDFEIFVEVIKKTITMGGQ